MFERYEGNETVNAGNNNFDDGDIPEPLEYWSLGDFEDLLPGIRK